MVSPPSLPNLEPKSMQWVRWVTERVKNLEAGHDLLSSNASAADTQRATAQTATANVVQAAATTLTINVPTAAPQTAVAPILTSDHGTVTITWDGTLYANLAYVPVAGEDMGPKVAPNIGFNRVNVYRSTDNATFTLINYIATGNTRAVDTNVQVGTTYYYRFIVVDNLGQLGTPGPSASIVVLGVDLGTLSTDVTNAIGAAQAAGVAGQNAAAAAQQAAGTADSKASQALNNAASAQYRADAAYAQAQNATNTHEIYIGTSQPTDTTGNLLWIDTTNNANTPKRYLNGVWTTLTDKAATDAANAAVAAQNAANAAQQAANNALAVANAAQGSANTAQQTANSKNTVNYSINAPSGKGNNYGDLWFQYNGSNVVGQWYWDGSNWQPKQLDNAVIATLDAGKLTAGIISADRIGANTITAQKMVTGTINAASGVLADAVITTAKIADLAVNNAKINDLDGNKIQAATIVAGKLAAGSVTTNNIVAGAIDTNRIAAGAVTTNSLNATAIDGMTITGAVFRTSGNAGSNGVQMDANGLRGYQNNAQTFAIDNNGNVSLTGYVNATGGNFTGYINAQAGYISGNLNMTGSIISTNPQNQYVTQLTNGELFARDVNNNYRIYYGWYGIVGITQGGSSNIQFNANDTTITSSPMPLKLYGGGYGADFIVDGDGSGGRVYSMAIRNRLYTGNSRTDNNNNRLMVVTPAGTIGQLTAVINSNYTSSSSIRFKHDIEDWRPDVDTILKLNPVKFRYNEDNSLHVGMIAEQVAELGLEELVSRNDDGEIQTIEYLFFGAALLHVAREQQKQIASLEQRLQEAGL